MNKNFVINKKLNKTKEILFFNYIYLFISNYLLTHTGLNKSRASYKKHFIYTRAVHFKIGLYPFFPYWMHFPVCGSGFFIFSMLLMIVEYMKINNLNNTILLT